MTKTDAEIIRDYFKDQPNGRFLEIGSDDGNPTQESEPCWTLVEKGWSGVYCEPNPVSCARLLENLRQHSDPSRFLVYNGAIWLASKLQPFYVNNDMSAISSISSQWAEGRYHGTKRYSISSILTHAISFQEFLDYVGTNFDVISIDIEVNPTQLEYLIKSIDWKQLSDCKVLTLEGNNDNIVAYLREFGYTFAGHSTYGNSFFFRDISV